MWTVLNKLAKKLAVVAAIVVILLALGIGGFRILATQLPVYQVQLQTWVRAELGLSLDFERVDARWGLRGPELSFYGVSVANIDAPEAFLRANLASVVFDPVSLLLDSRPAISAVALEAARLTVVRTEAGRFQVQGAPAIREFGQGLFDAIPAEMELIVRDSRLVYLDAERQESWLFIDIAASAIRETGHLGLELRAVPPAALGERIELSLEGDIGAGDSPNKWSVFGELRDADVAALIRLSRSTDTVALDGSGDISLWLDVVAGDLARGLARVAMIDVVLNEASDSPYERLVLSMEWTRGDDKGWQLAFNDVDVTRNGERWANGGNSTVRLTRDNNAIQGIDVKSDFLRLQDLMPILRIFPDNPIARQLLARDPVGDLAAIDVSLKRVGAEWNYAAAGEFDALGVAAYGSWPGFSGLSGELRSDTRSGTIQFGSRIVELDWPTVFGETLRAEQISGLVIWRQGRDLIRIVSNDLVMTVLDAAVRSNLELTLPLDGSSPSLDLETTVTEFDILAAKRYLPVNVMSGSVSRWLDRALQGGQISNLNLSFFGSLASFPFDTGDGEFRATADVHDADIEFVENWPRAEELTGRVEFLNTEFRGRASGRILGNISDNVDVGFKDLRNPVLTVQADTTGPLNDVVAFMKGAPLIAQHLGPGYERVEVLAGTGDVALDLNLPLLNRSDYSFNGALRILDGALSVQGLRPSATEINGVLDINGAVVTGDDIRAVFLDGPISARVSAPEQSGYRAQLEVEGETTADAIQSILALPLDGLIAGQARWQGRVQIPVLFDGDAQPVRISVESNLAGMALRLPEPFAKTPAEPTNMRLDFSYPSLERLQVRGNLGATRRFAADYAERDDGYELTHAALQFGGDLPQLPRARGVTVDGSLPVLNLNEWFALREALNLEQAQSMFIGGELRLADLSVFGQQLGSSSLSVRRSRAAWNVDIDSEAIAGNLSIPRQQSQRSQIVARMQRLYLSNSAGVTMEALNPRELPGLSLRAEEFGIGTRRLGRVDAEVIPDPFGLRMASFSSASEHIVAEGSGSWLDGSDGVATRVAVNISSVDVAAALDELGFDPVIEGESADVTASVYWDGSPSTDWMHHVYGDVALRVDTGSMLALDPGAGRVVGLMSIVALPRRLALDFRDVFNKGLVFDEIAGDFRLIDGDAFTDNLKLAGPGAEIGVVGRTGLRDRDYEQQAVVTAEPSNVLPTVGALLSGAGVGAALLIFTRIFKETLKGLGRASYCVTGSWDEPTVERLSAEQLQQDEFCAALPPGDLAVQVQP